MLKRINEKNYHPCKSSTEKYHTRDTVTQTTTTFVERSNITFGPWMMDVTLLLVSNTWM